MIGRAAAGEAGTRRRVAVASAAGSTLERLLHTRIQQPLTMQKTLGIILIGIGIVMLIWTGFSFTKREKVVDAGPVHITADKEKNVNWPPYAGGILVLGGIALLATARRTT